MTRMMSSPQCTGYDNKDLLHMEMCLPDKDTIIRSVMTRQSGYADSLVQFKLYKTKVDLSNTVFLTTVP